MKNELQLLAPSKRTTHLKQLLQKCGRVIPSEFPSLSFNHDYAIARQHQRSKNSLQNEVELLRIGKIQENRTPVDTLLSNFCYSIEDVKEFQKNPEKLRCLNLTADEVQSLLQDVLFILEKRRQLQCAATRLGK
ncbi:hypothetical protein M3Y98_01110400 [Aphelenchoides besseyi]|nr:hypothetical protein M3Y98_01110400 [Aphelenchoides besseyi]KAI6209226.1 hypothetical protein M3Y96_00198900 [Aphelenchoides besseyi]